MEILEFGDILYDPLYFLVHIVLLVVLVLLELFDPLIHLLHPVRDMGILLLNGGPQLTQGIGHVFNVGPGAVGLCFFDFLEYRLIFGEILIV